MSEFTNGLSAVDLIAAIATDKVETEPAQIKEQRDDFIRICKEWLQINNLEALTQDNQKGDE
jgi:hypothetical protein